MNRALILASVAWMCGACSSDSGGGNGNATTNGGGGLQPMGGNGGENDPGGPGPQNPAVPPLTVESISPEDGANEVALNATIEIQFSAALNPATVNSTSVVVSGPNGPLEGDFE